MRHEAVLKRGASARGPPPVPGPLVLQGYAAAAGAVAREGAGGEAVGCLTALKMPPPRAAVAAIWMVALLPPLPVVLPERVQAVRASGPLLKIPPPLAAAATEVA